MHGRLAAFAMTLAASAASAQWSVEEFVDPSGNGSFPLGAPTGLAVGPDGSLYIADSVVGQVLRVDPAGVVSQLMNSTGAQGFPLSGPGGIAVDGAGNAYVCAFGSDNVFRISPSGSATQVMDLSGDGNGNLLETPIDVTTDASGRVYVCCATSDNAFRIDLDGSVTEILDESGDGIHGLDNARGISVGPSGAVYVGGYSSNNAFRVDPSGAIEQIIDGAGDGRSALVRTQDVLEDTHGNVYVSGRGSHNVFRVDPDGTIVQVLDSTGNGLVDAAFLSPDDSNMAIDALDHVLVAGANSNSVFRIAPSGSVSVVLNASGGGSAPLDYPCGIAVGPTTEVYVGACISDNVFRLWRTSDMPIQFPDAGKAFHGRSGSRVRRGLRR